MPQGYAQNWWVVRLLGKQSYLLAGLMSLLVLLPILTSKEASPFWISSILTFILITGPLSVATRPFGFYLALILSLITLLHSWFGDAGGTSLISRIGQAATVSVFLLLGVQIFREYLLGNKEVHSETLVAAVNAYICMGIMYAFAYRFLLAYDPNAFSHDFSGTITFDICVYLSFVTMTTLGYGDITPMTSTGMVLTWTQALVGQLFIALTIARIVGTMASKSPE